MIEAEELRGKDLEEYIKKVDKIVGRAFDEAGKKIDKLIEEGKISKRFGREKHDRS